MSFSICERFSAVRENASVLDLSSIPLSSFSLAEISAFFLSPNFSRFARSSWPRAVSSETRWKSKTPILTSAAKAPPTASAIAAARTMIIRYLVTVVLPLLETGADGKLKRVRTIAFQLSDGLAEDEAKGRLEHGQEDARLDPARHADRPRIGALAFGVGVPRVEEEG